MSEPNEKEQCKMLVKDIKDNLMYYCHGADMQDECLAGRYLTIHKIFKECKKYLVEHRKTYIRQMKDLSVKLNQDPNLIKEPDL